MLSLINTVLVVLVVNIQVEARIGGQRAMIDATSLQSVEDVRRSCCCFYFVLMYMYTN